MGKILARLESWVDNKLKQIHALENASSHYKIGDKVSKTEVFSCIGDVYSLLSQHNENSSSSASKLSLRDSDLQR